MIELGEGGLIGGLSGGTEAALENRNFEDGFRSGFITGAAFSALRVAVFGVRYDPSSVKSDFHSETSKQFAMQNLGDKSFIAGDVARAGMPDPSTVTFRKGGLVSLLSDRSFTFGDTVHTSDDTMTRLKNGNTVDLAHELRHVAQERSLGIVVFSAVWLVQEVTRSDQYEPGNTSLEPYYKP
jgi:hypothetical protein